MHGRVKEMSVLERAEQFLLTDARLLERRLFGHLFHDSSVGTVVAAVLAYQNRDGGFGHALEPDLRTATSQPIFCELGLKALLDADPNHAPSEVIALRACNFLEGVADEHGAVSPALPGAADDPCADHWRIVQWATAPAVNPTASIAAHLHALGVDHPWRDRATKWSLKQIETETFSSAHTLRCALVLAEQLGREDLVERVIGQLADAEWFHADVPVTTYGQTPLHFAPTPDSPARPHFEDATIEAHLDDLASHQQEDGGWPIRWEAPGPVAVAEWRGIWTLDALRTLRAYGRI